MTDLLQPKTAIDRGPTGEQPVPLDQNRPEVLPEAGGDTFANDVDTNVGGAPATAGLDSGGAVGVRRGLEVGRPGSEYDAAPAGESSSDVVLPSDEFVEEDIETAAEEEEERTIMELFTD